MQAVVPAGLPVSPAPRINHYAKRFTVGDFVEYRQMDQSDSWSLGIIGRFLSENVVEVQIGNGPEWRCVQIEVAEEFLRPAPSSVFEDDD